MSYVNGSGLTDYVWLELLVLQCYIPPRTSCTAILCNIFCVHSVKPISLLACAMTLTMTLHVLVKCRWVCFVFIVTLCVVIYFILWYFAFIHLQLYICWNLNASKAGIWLQPAWHMVHGRDLRSFEFESDDSDSIWKWRADSKRTCRRTINQVHCSTKNSNRCAVVIEIYLYVYDFVFM